MSAAARILDLVPGADPLGGEPVAEAEEVEVKARHGGIPSRRRTSAIANSGHSPVALNFSVGVAWLLPFVDRAFGDGSANIHCGLRVPSKLRHLPLRRSMRAEWFSKR